MDAAFWVGLAVFVIAVVGGGAYLLRRKKSEVRHYGTPDMDENLRLAQAQTGLSDQNRVGDDA